MNKRKPSAIIAMMLVACLAVAVFGLRRVAERRHLVELGYEITKTSAKLRLVEQENQRLNLSYSFYTNPVRLQNQARALGLRPAAVGQVQNIDQDGFALPLTAKVAP